MKKWIGKNASGRSGEREKEEKVVQMDSVALTESVLPCKVRKRKGERQLWKEVDADGTGQGSEQRTDVNTDDRDVSCYQKCPISARSPMLMKADETRNREVKVRTKERVLVGSGSNLESLGRRVDSLQRIRGLISFQVYELRARRRWPTSARSQKGEEHVRANPNRIPGQRR